jgi:L-ascorbate metabolism protein UlaG (beta-lactamase superfamily)
MEIVSFGDTCLRLRGREGVVAADAFPRIVGPTGRGLTADIVTYSHLDGQSTLGLGSGASNGKSKAKGTTKGSGHRVPTSLEPAFVLDAPGEYEVHQVLITGVRTYRDEQQGAERGPNTCFVYELDGLHVVHLGDIGHVLSEDELGEVGAVDIVCVPIGGSLSAARAAEVVTQLDARVIVPMALDSANEPDEMARFLHEMSVQHGEPAPKLALTPSSMPSETTVVLLEPRGRN